jgi:hypothetical protein
MQLCRVVVINIHALFTLELYKVIFVLHAKAPKVRFAHSYAGNQTQVLRLVVSQSPYV